MCPFKRLPRDGDFMRWLDSTRIETIISVISPNRPFVKRYDNSIYQGLLDLGVSRMVTRERLERNTVRIVQAFYIPTSFINELSCNDLGLAQGTVIDKCCGKGAIYLTIGRVLRFGMDFK